jgi:hypothetical protein
MTTAIDTGNNFADPTQALQNAANVAASGTIKAVAPSAGASASENAYRDAWANEQYGNYGDINQNVLEPVAAPAAQEMPKFTQQGFTDTLGGFQWAQWEAANRASGSTQANPYADRITGGYGTFKYGMATPKEGTQEWRDMQEYKDWGGTDAANMYGWGAPAAAPAPQYQPAGGA